MPILAAMREGKSRRIVEPAGSPMNNVSNQGERLQCAWAEFLEQQEFGKAMKVAFISDCQNGAKAFQIYIFRMHRVMARHCQVTKFRRLAKGFLRMFANDVEHRALRRLRLGIDEIHDRALMFANDSSVRLGNKIAH